MQKRLTSSVLFLCFMATNIQTNHFHATNGIIFFKKNEIFKQKNDIRYKIKHIYFIL